MPSDLTPVCDQIRMVLGNIQGLVILVGLLASDNNGLNVLRLAECGLSDYAALIKQRLVLTREWAEAVLKVSELRRLEERVCTDGEDSGALRAARARVNELTAERASLTSGTEQAKGERDTLAPRICKLEGPATTFEGEIGIVVRAVRSLKSRVAEGEDRVSTEEVRARETLDKMSKLRAPVKGLNRTVVGEHARVTELLKAELVRVLSVITAALSESEGKVSNALCGVRDGFPVDACFDTPAPSAECLSEQAEVLFVV